MDKVLKIINNKIIFIKIILLFIISCYLNYVNVYSLELNFLNSSGRLVENTTLQDDYKKITPKYLFQNQEQAMTDDNEEKVIVSRKNKPSKIIYLTFDDGPSPNTIKVLDTLKANNVRATFFVNGRTEYREVYERMYKDGHCIGNHTYTHNYNSIYSSVDSFTGEVEKLSNYLNSIGIKDTKILRFPGGSNNTISNKYGGKKIMSNLTTTVSANGYEYYDWDVDSGDASATCVNKQIIINNIKRECKNRKSAIILMHDSATKKTTAEALPEIIAYLKSQNYEFKVLTSEASPVVHFQ